MSHTQHDLAERLASCDVESLRIVLEAEEMRVSDQDGPEALARRIASAIWWRTHTPLGKVAMADDLGGIIRRIARKAQLDLPESSDDLELLEALTSAVVAGDELVLEEVDPVVMKRLRSSHWAEWLGVGTAGSAVGSKFAAAAFLKWTAPIADWLPYVPKVGPILVGVRQVSKTVVKVAAPIGIGISLLTLNSVLGADFDRALPLLLGAGLSLRGASAATPEEAVQEPQEEPEEEAPLDADFEEVPERGPPDLHVVEPEVLSGLEDDVTQDEPEVIDVSAVEE